MCDNRVVRFFWIIYECMNRRHRGKVREAVGFVFISRRGRFEKGCQLVDSDGGENVSLKGKGAGARRDFMTLAATSSRWENKLSS